MLQRLFSFRSGEDAAQCIQRGAVPKILLAGFGGETVRSPEFRREQGVNRAWRAVVDADSQRDANPRAEMVRFVGIMSVATQRYSGYAGNGFIEVAIGFETFHVAAEIIVDGCAQSFRARFIIAGERRGLAKFARE